jgi:hypothetical protein
MIQVEATTDDRLGEFLDSQTRMHRRLQRLGKQYIAVMDCSIAARLTPVQRRMYTDWLQDNDQALKECLLGAAFVMPNALVRGALTAIFWVVKLSAPHTVHRTLDGALDWSLARAHECDARMSPQLRREGVDVFRPLTVASA